MRSSSLNLLCRTANRLSRAATHPFSAISPPHRSKRLPSCRGGSPAADDAPPPTADYHERTALSKRLTRSRELSAQNALVWVRGFRVFRLFLARVRVRWFSFFPFTSSPTYCNKMIINVFGVKTFAFRLHPLPHTPGLHRTARKVCFSAGLFSKARKYRPETADGEGKSPKPSPQTYSTSADCAQWVKE